MHATKHSLPLTTLGARRQAPVRELAAVEKQIVEAERKQKRLEEHIRFLEQGQRQAA